MTSDGLDGTRSGDVLGGPSAHSGRSLPHGESGGRVDVSTTRRCSLISSGAPRMILSRMILSRADGPLLQERQRPERFAMAEGWDEVGEQYLEYLASENDQIRRALLDPILRCSAATRGRDDVRSAPLGLGHT